MMLGLQGMDAFAEGCEDKVLFYQSVDRVNKHNLV